jgi:flagellar protein FlbT
MVLKVTLAPNEKIIVNGCALRNANREYNYLVIESFGDVIREKDILTEKEADTPVKRVYFKIQTALIHIKQREALISEIQDDLAELATIFGGENLGHIFDAATFVSSTDYYKALKCLKKIFEYEAAVLRYKTSKKISA